MKKHIIVLLACMLLLAGCETEKRESGDTASSIDINDIDGRTDDSMSNDNNTTEAKVEYVTAKEFMEHYSITEDQVPADYVQAFIDDLCITADELERDERENIKGDLLWAYENGVLYGYNINRIFQGKASNENLSEYMKQAEVIMFDLEIHDGSELVFGQIMVIDLRDGNIYFSRGREEEYTEDYINFELVAELSDDDIVAIRKELPEHIEENKGVGDFGMSVDYSFRIKMLAADGTTKYFDGDSDDEEHFPGFDGYWKGLYKKYFGVEYEFTRP